MFCGRGWWLVPLRAGLVALWDIRSLAPWWVTTSPRLGLTEAGMAQHWDPPSQRRLWGQEAHGALRGPSSPHLFIEGHVFHPSTVGFQKSSKQWHVSCPCFCSSETSGICRMSFAFPLVPS